jgi:hypothetical protein
MRFPLLSRCRPWCPITNASSLSPFPVAGKSPGLSATSRIPPRRSCASDRRICKHKPTSQYYSVFRRVHWRFRLNRDESASNSSSRLKHSKAIRVANECAPEESGRQHAIDPRIGNVLIAGNERRERNLLQGVESHLYVLGRQNRVGMRCTVGAATMQRRAAKAAVRSFPASNSSGDLIPESSSRTSGRTRPKTRTGILSAR